jgi:hypothetical protein
MTEHFGWEFGYGETRRKHEQVRLGPGESSPGAAEIHDGHYQVYDTALSISQPYVSLKYKHNIGEKLQFFGAVGITPMKLHAAWENTDDTGVPNPMSRVERTKSIEIRKTIPLIRIGAYYRLNSSFSLRVLTTWSQTSIPPCTEIIQEE